MTSKNNRNHLRVVLVLMVVITHLNNLLKHITEITHIVVTRFS